MIVTTLYLSVYESIVLIFSIGKHSRELLRVVFYVSRIDSLLNQYLPISGHYFAFSEVFSESFPILVVYPV